MALYSFSPRLRFTPPAGAPVVVDLTTLDRLVRAEVLWEPLIDEIEMVDRSIQTERYGWRLGVLLEVFCTPGSVTDLALEGQVNHWLNRSDTTTEVSMDGGGVYRIAHLTRWTRTKPKPANVGVVYSIRLTCEYPISEDALPPEGRTAPATMEGWA
jgi:hypothetical protein